jgi:hypothetical protein
MDKLLTPKEFSSHLRLSPQRRMAERLESLPPRFASLTALALASGAKRFQQSYGKQQKERN